MIVKSPQFNHIGTSLKSTQHNIIRSSLIFYAAQKTNEYFEQGNLWISGLANTDFYELILVGCAH